MQLFYSFSFSSFNLILIFIRDRDDRRSEYDRRDTTTRGPVPRLENKPQLQSSIHVLLPEDKIRTIIDKFSEAIVKEGIPFEV
jgi:hypothetical protein